MDWSKEEYEETYKLISNLLRNPASLYITEEKVNSSLLLYKKKNFL